MRLLISLLAVLAISTPSLAAAGGAGVTASQQSSGQGEALQQPAVAIEAVQSSSISDELRQILGSLQGLSASFEQSVADGEGFEVQSMAGEMIVARPGKIHWQTDPPFEQLLVSDAQTLWLYDRDLAQVTVRPFMRDIVNSPAMLFIGDLSELDSKYRISRAQGESGMVEFTLVPKDASAVYQRLAVRFDGKQPTAMVLWDSLGQVTTITFSNVLLNPSIPEAMFQFSIPQGVDILYND